MSDPNPRTVVEHHAAQNHGLILRAFALESGATKTQVRRRVERRQWVPGPHRGAFILRAFADSPLAQLNAGIEAIGPGAIAWGRSALALFDLADFPTTPVIAASRRVICAKLDSTIVSNLSDLGTTKRQGIRTAPLPVAIASVAASSKPGDMDELVDDALRRQLTTWTRLEDAFELMSGRGRAGANHRRRIMGERSTKQAIPLSRWSRDTARKLVAADLPEPELEWRIETNDGALVAQVDLAYPQHRYAIELDSIAFHHNQTAFQEDRARDARLTQHGWRVGRFTWTQCTTDWPFVVATVQAGLAGAHPTNQAQFDPQKRGLN